MCDALVAPAVGTALLLTALSLPAADDSTATVVDAERSFARYSVEHGMREAFLQFLADDAILFRPLPVNGKKWFEGRPPAPGALLWQPTYARVSEAGDLGVTSGPWEFKPSDTTAASSFGHFLTVWRKQADGTWRVELDAGIGHPRLDRTPELDARADPAREPVLLSPSASARAAQSLLAAERRLGKLAANWGLAEALAARATGDFRLYRHDAPPTIGVQAARERLKGEKRTWIFQPRLGAVSSSGDLAYTYGIAQARPARPARGSSSRAGAAIDSSTFVRVWRRGDDRRWRVSVDLETPLPRPGK